MPTGLNPDCPLDPSFPRKRESSEINTRRSGQNLDVDPLRGNFSIIWIPACAGMTDLMDNLGLFKKTAIHPDELTSHLTKRGKTCAKSLVNEKHEKHEIKQ